MSKNPKASDAFLDGFMLEEPNMYFSSIDISPTEDLSETLNSITTAPLERFRFSEVSEHDVILVVSYFKSQARGNTVYPKVSLPQLFPYLLLT